MDLICDKYCGFQVLRRNCENTDGVSKPPVLLFLHGMGSRGNDISKLRENPFFDKAGPYLGKFNVIAPQCADDTWFDCFERLKTLVHTMQTDTSIDQDRIYLMGTSMGGYAAWQLGMSMPNVFAAIIPICGGGLYANAARLIHIPVWAFHGALDQTVDVQESLCMVRAIQHNGGEPRLTIYPDAAHDCWNRVYADSQVWEWLSMQRKRPHIIEASLCNAAQYG